MTDPSPTEAVIRNLLAANPLREPLLRSIVRSLDLSPGSRGLDIGCGIGLQASLLAQAVGEAGHVTGLDVNTEFLSHAEKRIGEAGLTRRIDFKEGEMCHLPFDDGAFDWVWSADCAGYPHGDMPSILREVKRVLKPGGRVFILAWSSQQILPGYQLMEARLNAVCSNYHSYLAGKDPEGYFLNSLRWFREAGLEDVCGQTFVSDVQAPLTHEIRTSLASLIGMLWDEERLLELSPTDRNDFLSLCREDSPGFILDNPGYYAFFTYTLFRGKAPGV